MAEILVILGVQAAVIGTVASLNYSNTSEGFGRWDSWTWSTPQKDEVDEDVQLSQEPPAIVVHRKQQQNSATMKTAHAIAPTQPARLRDFEWHFKEEMEYAYE
jgi:hypothetical protein